MKLVEIIPRGHVTSWLWSQSFYNLRAETCVRGPEGMCDLVLRCCVVTVETRCVSPVSV